MSFDTYGLSNDVYLKLFEEEAELHFEALKLLSAMAIRHGVSLSQYDPKFIWEFFQSCAYGADDKARVIQKEQDPEEVKRRSWDSTILPTREDMMDEIKDIKQILLDLVDKE